MATEYDAYDAVLHYIFGETHGDAWFKPLAENLSAGVCLRVQDTPTLPSPHYSLDPNAAHAAAMLQIPAVKYRVFPYENMALAPFESAVRALNPAVAVKVRSAAVYVALASVAPTTSALFVDSNTRIQILETMSRLPRADKEQCAAFIRDERVLVVWSDALDTIIPTCHDFRRQLNTLVMRSLSSRSSPVSNPARERDVQLVSSAEGANINSTEKWAFKTSPTPAPCDTQKKARMGWGSGHRPHAGRKAKSGDAETKKRKTVMYAPFYCGLGCALSLCFMGSGLQVLIEEWRLDGDFSRFALCATMPFLFCFSLFFSLQIVGSLSYVIGPVAQFYENSEYYSAIAPPPNRTVDDRPPHVTIQMPVYQESLEKTITPSVESLKKAMQTYTRQGGTSNIFICDDGMQLISPAERAARQAFYAKHDIGWVARPKHDPAGTGFVRAGRFKKASNMNYGLALSLKVEKFVLQLQEVRNTKAAAALDGWGNTHGHSQGYAARPRTSNSSTRSGPSVPAMGETDDDELDIEERALQLALEETYEETGKQWKPWAANGRAIRVGEIILIVDSDTIVPEDCFRDAARELAESPEVAVIQHASDVMQVAHHWFENGIAYFTRRANKSISMACASGEVAPFVGHNAFLRWKAIQDAAFIDNVDGIRKIWSESNVSEDFDMALRLQVQGYSIRWASYSHGGFKEGVSLTLEDELNRWERYAYGCSELMFNPFIEWWHKGPITAKLHKFMSSDAPLHYKVSMVSYIFSYYGIAAGFMLPLLNYILLGSKFPVDRFYLHSFEILLAWTVVFPNAGNIGFTIMEYRLGHKNLLESFLTNVAWLPFFSLFFGGLGIHLTKALLAHMFSYNMIWQATKKEVERSTLFTEGPRIIKRFWLSFVLSFAIVAGLLILRTDPVSSGWQMPGLDWGVILPLAVTAGCHILSPIILNPWLLIFS